MKVSFTLHRTDHPASATAVLLLSENPADLLALCVRMAAETAGMAREWPALPPIHAVPGGYLIKLGRPLTAVFPGTIRLRSRCANLFLPVDAELVPALLDDEAAGLVRERGLIFLPGGRVLAFAPDQFVTADHLLTFRRFPDRRWSALPARPRRPERLEEIKLDRPDETPNLILESGGEGIGTETPRPADAGPMASAAGKAALGAGQGLAWLGNLLRWPGLTKLGASLAAGAMRFVPRLSESLLGRQEAALRELLRKFRAGNLEEALRHALPLSNDPGRGGQLAGNAQLPTHGLRYRLSDLLSGAGGSANTWFTSVDVHAQLMCEYHKAAVAATARGDHRRAAFIYGRLLNDYRRAADVLSRGGLHHDAAILYLEVLRDNLAAARAFEAAGETDRALQLYQQRGEYVLAGDLLRRVGEDEEALLYYVRAADQLAAADNHLAAAELLLSRAGRSDLARDYYVRGWARRPHGSAIPCLLRLMQWHTERQEQQPLLTLIAEAETFFGPPGNEHGASQFCNALAQLADHANLLALREELRDRALRGLAGKLRQRTETDVHPGVIVSELFGRSGGWNAALVSDADFAFKASFKKKEKASKKTVLASAPRLRLGTGQMTAVCAARASGRVFLGFNDGRITCFDPKTESLLTLATTRPNSPIIALSTNDYGNQLIALLQTPDESALLSFWLTETNYDRVGEQTPSSLGPGWLTPVCEVDGQDVVGLWEGDHLDLLDGDDLLPLARLEPCADRAQAGLLFRIRSRAVNPSNKMAEMSVCLFVGETLWYFASFRSENGIPFHLGWRPCSWLRGLCSPPPLSWGWSGLGPLELVGIDEDQSIHWTELDCREPARATLGGGASTQQMSYRAAALVRPGLIAGVHERGVDWLRRKDHRLLPSSATQLDLEEAVACFTSPPTGELLVVCRPGSVLRVPLPA